VKNTANAAFFLYFADPAINAGKFRSDPTESREKRATSPEIGLQSTWRGPLEEFIHADAEFMDSRSVIWGNVGRDSRCRFSSWST
jgi:hypothetical protein